MAPPVSPFLRLCIKAIPLGFDASKKAWNGMLKNNNWVLRF